MTVDLMAPGTARRAPERRSNQAVSHLVGAAASGDQRAWNALVEEFSGLIWAVARAFRLHDADAADVMQVTWLLLLEHFGSINKPERIGAWLAVTARRECLRVLQAAQRYVLSEDELAKSEFTDSVLEDLLTAERDEVLWRCFARLRPSDQALLRLLVADPRPAYEEIAVALDMPIGSIGPTRARALDRLRQELEREGQLSLPTA